MFSPYSAIDRREKDKQETVRIVMQGLSVVGRMAAEAAAVGDAPPSYSGMAHAARAGDKNEFHDGVKTWGPMEVDFSIAHFKRWMESEPKEEGLPTRTSERAKS